MQRILSFFISTQSQSTILSSHSSLSCSSRSFCIALNRSIPPIHTFPQSSLQCKGGIRLFAHCVWQWISKSSNTTDFLQPCGHRTNRFTHSFSSWTSRVPAQFQNSALRNKPHSRLHGSIRFGHKSFTCFFCSSIKSHSPHPQVHI